MMTNDPLDQALDALVVELEGELVYFTELKAEMERNAARRSSLLVGMRGAYMAMPLDARRPWRQRVFEAISLDSDYNRPASKRPGRQQAALDYMTENLNKEIRVGNVQRALREAGFTGISKAYSSNLLRRLEKRRICKRIRHGVYEVNALHREILDRCGR